MNIESGIMRTGRAGVGIQIQFSDIWAMPATHILILPVGPRAVWRPTVSLSTVWQVIAEEFMVDSRQKSLNCYKSMKKQ